MLDHKLVSRRRQNSPKLLRYHSWVVFSDNIVHPLDQIQALKSQVRRALLKVANAEELILINILIRVISNMRHQPSSYVATVVRY
ncbi:Uncharacterised protein [Klebsiella pneumoniae]|nr:Uncharacterised protein [Klebsiella pneumoniae]